MIVFRIIYSPRRLLHIFIFMALLPALSYAQNASQNKLVTDIIRNSTLNGAQISLFASYLDNSADLLNYDGEKSLAPASGLKLLTTAAAMHYLGTDLRFKTHLCYSGTLKDNGILDGNLYIVGGGDPTLASTFMDDVPALDSLMHNWVSSVKKSGIKAVNGDIIADVSLFDEHDIPNYWPWIDMGNYYAAGTCALSIHDNLYFLYFKPGKYIGDRAKIIRTIPKINGLEFDNHMKTGRHGSGDNGYIYSAPGQYNILVRGTVPAGRKEFYIKGVIPDPARFCAEYFRSSLLSEEIRITGESICSRQSVDINKTKVLCTTFSPELGTIIFYINKKSINLYAEQLLYHIAMKNNLQASTRQGIKTITTLLKENSIPVNGFKIFDGSGLSRTNRITTTMMVRLLQFCSKQEWFPEFYNSLALTGDPEDMGSFKHYGRNTILQKNARVKSGTIMGARSLSGYVKGRSGRMIAFSFIVNNFDISGKKIRRIFRDILVKIADTY